MRISLFQPSNAVRENVSFKALARQRETDLHQRGFDLSRDIVALNGSSPSTDVRLMSTQELEDYLIETLGQKQHLQLAPAAVPLAETSPRLWKLFRPDDWIVVGKTLPRPSSHGGRDTGYSKPRPQATLHACLYSCAAASQNKTFDVSSKMGREHAWSKRVGVPKTLFKHRKRVTATFTKMVPSPSNS
jgi:hypothetical protein